MSGYRAERVAELVHRELAERLREGGADPRLVDVSITRVVVTRDLERASIHYLPLGGGAPTRGLVEALEQAARAFRGPIGRALSLRHAPELAFVVDEQAIEAFRVTGLLDRLRREREDNT